MTRILAPGITRRCLAYLATGSVPPRSAFRRSRPVAWSVPTPLFPALRLGVAAASTACVTLGGFGLGLILAAGTLP